VPAQNRPWRSTLPSLKRLRGWSYSTPMSSSSSPLGS
jgi:hypothetical protein